MKAKSKGTGIKLERRNKILRRGLAGPLLAVAAVLACNLVDRATAAEAPNACQQTAADASTACRSSAQSDYQIALGKCVNVSDHAARKACQKQAAVDLDDALQTCKGGLAVRIETCGKLGPAPYDPVIDPANFVAKIDNPYFPMVPGTTFIYEGQTSEGPMRDEFAVTHNARVIDGVRCVEVHDSVFTNGELTEDTLDWFAQDKEGNVWYFGENTAELENGLLSTIDGSFMAGVDGDKPGIVMKAHPAVGDFYRQEFSLGNAEDEAETIGLNASVTVRMVLSSTVLNHKRRPLWSPTLLEDKFYAPGIGNVLTIDEKTGETI